jgi:putative membrane protein
MKVLAIAKKKLMRTFIFTFTLAMISLVVLQGLTYKGPLDEKKSANGKDSAFVAQAADAGMLEVQLGKLAANKGSSDDVKKFGENMVNDHMKANDELKALAQKKGIKVPAALSTKSQRKYEELSKKTGTDFDKAYAAMMVKDHEEVIAKFKQEAQTGNDPDLKAWAQGKIQTLEHHHMMAQDMQKNAGQKNNKK